MDGRLDCSSQTWSLRLLKCWDLRRGAQPFPIGAREQRLVAFLALNGRRLRSYIAGVLWPESSQHHAQGNLRAAVFQTQRAAPDLLAADRTTIDLAPGTSIDVRDVRNCLEQVVRAPFDADVDAALRTLDSGELMPGWYEDWVIYERERLQHDRVRGLEALAATEIDRGNTETAVVAARAAATIEPLRDTARSLEIQAHLLAGNAAEAIRVYRGYAALLRSEMGIEPSEGIQRLLIDDHMASVRRDPVAGR
jgi:DNA-binding SARP family transcriptional activator